MNKILKNKLFEHIDKFKESKILVVGDIILDEYIWGMANRRSPEAPVPVLQVKRKTYLLGGAANVANNIAAMGAKAILAGVIGEDPYSSVVLDMLKKSHVDTQFVIKDKTRPTTVKTRLIAQNNKHLARVDNESLEKVSDSISKQIFENIENGLYYYRTYFSFSSFISLAISSTVISLPEDSNAAIIFAFVASMELAAFLPASTPGWW